MRIRWVAVVAAVAVTIAASAQLDPAARPYPQGDRFPLGLYSVHAGDGLEEVAEAGWNFGHRYSFEAEYLDAAAAAEMFSLAHIDVVEDDADGAKTTALVADMAARESVLWWDLPEEMRYWRADEYDKVKNLSALTREVDPLKRPNFMYIAGHYTPAAIAKYVDYLDIVGVGCYTEYAHQPRPWVRWRIESEIEAIHLAGHEVGRDYQNGERTPIGVLMLFGDGKKADVLSPLEARHDFWSSICAGAQGVLIFSYWHKRDTEILELSYQEYARAAGQIAGEEQLGQVFLFGEQDTGVSFAVTKGPTLGAPFQPNGYQTEMRYPSLNVRAMKWNGNLYVLAVNSAERAVTATISGLPEAAMEATALFESATEENPDRPRVLPLHAGMMMDNFDGLGVHIYKIEGLQ